MVSLETNSADKQSCMALLASLRAHCFVDARDGMNGNVPPLVSAFVARERECIARFRPTTPGLVIIIEGSKQVTWGAERKDCAAGDALFLPADAVLDVINDPDPVTGIYRALYLQFPRAMMIEAARRWPEFATREPYHTIATIALDDTLASAVVHVAEGLNHCSARMNTHRLLGVLGHLAERGIVRFAPKYVERSAVEAIRLLVRHRLDQSWSAATVAVALGMSEATLRRRLASEGRSLRAVMIGERMDAAHRLLEERTADVAQAMAATGYVSRSHFGRHYKAAHGSPPSHSRRRRSEPAHK